MGKWTPLYCIKLSVVWVTVMHVLFEFDFNNIKTKSMYTKNDFEPRKSVAYITNYILLFYDIIVIVIN